MLSLSRGSRNLYRIAAYNPKALILSSGRALLLAIALNSSAAVAFAHAPSQVAARPAEVPPAPPTDGVTMNGPPPPVAPDTIARDEQGRVTLRASRITRPMKID